MVYLGADHRGFHLKEALKEYLAKAGIGFEDLGARSLAPDDDFVDYALPVAQAVGRDPEEHLGIVVCGSGVGAAMTANKVKGVRAGLFFDTEQAGHARAADAVNVVALAADYTPIDKAMAIVGAWLDTPVGNNPRYQRRLQKLSTWEDQVFQ